MERRTRYAATLLVAAAIAVPAAAAVATPGAPARSVQPAVGTAFVATRPTIPEDCLYPPQTAPTVVLVTNRVSARRNQEIRLSGSVTVNSCALKNWRVALYAADTPTGTGDKVDSKKSRSDGTFRFKEVKIRKTTYFYAVTEGAEGLDGAQSNVIKVTFVN